MKESIQIKTQKGYLLQKGFDHDDMQEKIPHTEDFNQNYYENIKKPLGYFILMIYGFIASQQ